MKFLKIIKKNLFIIFGLFVFALIVAQFLAISEYKEIINALDENLQEKFSAIENYFYIIAALISLTAIYLFISILKPISHLKSKVDNIATKDMASLSNALTEIAQGNLTTKIKIKNESFSSSKTGEVGGIVNGLNLILENLQDASKEFNSVTDTPCKRLLYVGADSYLEGKTCAEVMGKSLNSKGNVAIFLESNDSVGQILRSKGFLNSIKEKFPNIKIVESIETKQSKEKLVEGLKTILQKHSDLDGIYVAYGSSSIGKVVKDLGKGNKLKVVTHDIDSETMEYVANGVITASVGQDVIGQGHDPVMHAYNNVVSGWKPNNPRMLTNMDIITKENYKQFWNNGIIESDEVKSQRPNPIKSADRKIKLAVLGRTKNSFWDALQSGVDNATRKLQSSNATVDWIIPKGSHDGDVVDISAEIYGKAVEEAIENKYDAIITGLFDKNLIPYLNKAVDKGITVTIFNSEPLSFRGLFMILRNNADELIKLSQSLAQESGYSIELSKTNATAIEQMVESLNEESSSINEVNSAMQEFSVTIDNIAHDSHDQKSATDRVLEIGNDISSAVQNYNGSMELISKKSEESIQIAQDGTESVKETLGQINTVENTIVQFAEKIQQMGQQSEKIGEIIKTIEDIAGQTNLLALNAAIEAARAGEQGKGFAVVADEVKLLADRSATATKESSELIGSVQKNINEANKAMDSIVNIVSDVNNQAETSGNSIDSLLNSSQEMNQQINQMVEDNSNLPVMMETLNESVQKISIVVDQNMSATEQLNAGVQHVAKMISNVADISSNNSSSINNISKNTLKANDEAEQISEVSKNLAMMADEFQGSTAQFKID